MRLVLALLLGASASAAAFNVATLPVSAHHRPEKARTQHVLMAEGSKGFPFRSAILALITVQSAFGLSQDIPRLFGERPDVFATLFDGGFFVYATRLLLGQAGVLKPDDSKSISLDGLTCTATLNIGREPGTWMPDEWGASGGRLSLPLVVRFTDETVDMGFPGEEALGGRYAKRLAVERPGSFIGAEGAVEVASSGGGWVSAPTGLAGVSTVRFYLDFPQEASRNDVTLPSGRVYFSTSCFADEEARINMMAPPEEVLSVDGVQVVNQGGLTIKGNGPKNAFGAFGDVMLILGRFSLSAVVPEVTENETPQQKAARERAEDAARGRNF